MTRAGELIRRSRFISTVVALLLGELALDAAHRAGLVGPSASTWFLVIALGGIALGALVQAIRKSDAGPLRVAAVAMLALVVFPVTRLADAEWLRWMAVGVLILWSLVELATDRLRHRRSGTATG